MKSGYTYIMGSPTGVLDIGVTSDMYTRTHQHKDGAFEGFSKLYNCTRLLYYEAHESISQSIAREKQLKGWRREKKLNLQSRIQRPRRPMGLEVHHHPRKDEPLKPVFTSTLPPKARRPERRLALSRAAVEEPALSLPKGPATMRLKPQTYALHFSEAHKPSSRSLCSPVEGTCVFVAVSAPFSTAVP
jgi:putative endonuclease